MAYKRIHSKGLYFRRVEYVANDAIEPGMLCELDSSGKVIPHSTEGGRAERLVAEEDALQGKAISDDYVATDIVTLSLAGQHDEYNMIMTGGETITIGEELISAGDGKLKARDNVTSGVTVQETIARALEAFSQTADGLMQVRFA